MATEAPASAKTSAGRARPEGGPAGCRPAQAAALVATRVVRASRAGLMAGNHTQGRRQGRGGALHFLKPAAWNHADDASMRTRIADAPDQNPGRRAHRLLLTACLAALAAAPVQAQRAPDDSSALALGRQVEVRRTAFGVPHIHAQNLRAAGFALAWVQLEDYGARIPLFLLKGRGELARHFGRDSLESDFQNRPNWLRAADRFHLLDGGARDVYDGFAAGVNRYI